jgi:tetratricopeptide (TPR) repeat protein
LGIKIAEGNLSWKPTPFDLAILSFAVTGFIAYLNGYERSLRWAFLWLIALAITFYFVTNRRTNRELWVMVDGWGFAAGALAVYFLFTNDWITNPTEFAWLQAISLRWTDLRPDLALETFEPNIVGGALATLLPLILAGLVRGWREGQREWTILRLLTLALTLSGLVLSSSRGAWVAVSLGTAVGLIWLVVSSTVKLKPFVSWALLMAIPILVMALWALTITNGSLPLQLERIIPGAPSAQSRIELTWDAIRLLQDYPFTGSGLASFAGQYSRYIRFISEFYFGYAHNLYMDIALAQGPFALSAMLTMLFGAIWLLAKAPSRRQGIWDEHRLLGAAVAAGLIVIMVHGLVDDPLYTSRGMLLLFFFPGAASAINRNLTSVEGIEHAYKTNGTSKWLGVNAAFIGITGIVIILGLTHELNPHSVRSMYAANQAAVSLARRELAGFPETVVVEIRDLAGDAIQRERLERALILDGDNRTALHRLGLLELRKGNFVAAADSLEKAAALDPDHTGIAKALGYTYVWLGEFDRADAILAHFPSAKNELKGYASYWSKLERTVLAGNADHMSTLLGN